MTLCGSHDGECPDPKSARPKDTVPSLLNEELQKLDKRAGSDAAMIYALHSTLLSGADTDFSPAENCPATSGLAMQLTFPA